MHVMVVRNIFLTQRAIILRLANFLRTSIYLRHPTFSRLDIFYHRQVASSIYQHPTTINLHPPSTTINLVSRARPLFFLLYLGWEKKKKKWSGSRDYYQPTSSINYYQPTSSINYYQPTSSIHLLTSSSSINGCYHQENISSKAFALTCSLSLNSVALSLYGNNSGEHIERFHIHSNKNVHKNNHGYIVKSAILLNQFQCASALKLWWKVQKRRKTLISSNFSVVNMENA